MEWYFGLVILGILIAVILLVKIITKPAYIENDEASLQRVRNLKNVLETSYGKQWSIVFVILFICFLAIVGLMYYISIRAELKVTDEQYRIIYWFSILFFVILGIGLGMYAIQMHSTK
jgi:hypothetical protein